MSKSDIKSEPQEVSVDKKTKKFISVEFKPGQKKETPSPGAGTRVFYESLYKQKPSSLMALKWCLEYGVIPREECKAKLDLLEKLQSQAKKEKSNPEPPAKKQKTSSKSSGLVGGDGGIDRLGTGGDEGIGLTNL